jgi:hypothetical protein
MGKKAGKCCKKYKQGKRCKHCPKTTLTGVGEMGRLVQRRQSVAVGLLSLVTFLAPAPVWPVEDDWLEAFDAEQALLDRAAAVNDGELEFIPAEAANGAHAHLNRVRITPASLTDGWIGLEQCHENIDAVPAAQILFRAGGIRNLEIASSVNIGRAWVEGHSVQLEDVAKDATLCIRGESKALHQIGNGQYRLRNGPYMRRFLDGYYPMRVVLSIDYPSELIRLVGQSPNSQLGFDVEAGDHSLEVVATFEGRLVTCFDFCALGADDCETLLPACATQQ